VKIAKMSEVYVGGVSGDKVKFEARCKLRDWDGV
jgi:hypothetical protein